MPSTTEHIILKSTCIIPAPLELVPVLVLDPAPVPLVAASPGLEPLMGPVGGVDEVFVMVTTVERLLMTTCKSSGVPV